MTPTAETGHWRPTVSVVLPVLNEERHIAEALQSVFDQDYPAELIEIMVADGGSTDQTRTIVSELARSDSRVRLLDNPGRNQAAGLNVAIDAGTSEVVARLDGHAVWRPWHLSRCIAILAETGADNVGGTMEATGENATGEAIARASSSPFGVGGARYRYARGQTTTDTVWLGCFRREVLERVGRFNEAYPPHEDYELNHRIVASGGQIVFSPDVPARYWARSSWPALLRQYFRYGRAKARVARNSPGVVRPYHLVPVAFVGATVLGMLTRRTRYAVGVAAVAYGTACAVAAIPAGDGAPRKVGLRIPFAFAGMHLAWGTGFWAGLLEAVRE
jgi:succinoglycan biosynthesis protein ExoA